MCEDCPHAPSPSSSAVPRAELEALVRQNAGLQAVITDLRADKADLRAHIERLTAMIDDLRRKLDFALGKLGLAEPEQARSLKAEADRASATDARPSRAPSPPPARKETREADESHRNGRGKVPEGLPRDTHEHRLERCPRCHGEHLHVRGRHVVERHDLVRSHVRARRDVIYAYGCNDCDFIGMAPSPPEPFDRAACTSALLAWVIVSKLALHLPLERLARDLAWQGDPLATSTLATWFARGGEAVKPLYDALLRALASEGVLQTDGTGLRVLPEGVRGEGKRRKAAFGNVTVLCTSRIALYFFKPDKKGVHLAELLDEMGWNGPLVADAASTHDQLFADGRRVEAGCNAHGRRKFAEAEETSRALAEEGGRWVAAMYDLEREAVRRGLRGEALLAYRQEHIAPVARDFRAWLEKSAPLTLPKSKIGQAVRYYVRHWDALTRFLTDPRLPLDNNLAERLLRAIAVGRKNFLFAGSADAAERLCWLQSLVQTCLLHDVDPFEWLTDVLDRMAPHPDHRDVRVEDLLPWTWKAAREPKPPD